jgi:hypothetical protein
MAGGLVEYIIGLKDAFSAQAEKVAAASKAAQAAVKGMGSAINTTEAALKTAAAQANVAAASINKLSAADRQAAIDARNRAQAYAMQNAAGAKGAALEEKRYGQALKAEELAKRQAAGGGSGGGGFFAGTGSKLMNAWAGLQLGSMAVHGADHLVSQVGDVQAMREKIKWAMGGDKNAADDAYKKAMDLSGKYKNTSVLENMHVIDDLRANLPESFDHILKDAADPFVRMHSFFKAWEGGKHSGKASGALKDIGAAIRAGELTGINTADDLVKHTQALATAKILFGEKFKMQEYFQATQKAATALSASDDTFKYIDFPMLIQRLSQGAGVALQTGAIKYIAGGNISQGVAENWRALGLVDMSKVGPLDKNDKIKPNQLIGKKWLKDGDAFAKNFSDATMTKLVPELAKNEALKGLKGLDKAWREGDVESASKIMSALRKDKAAMAELTRQAVGLAKDRNGAKLIEEVIMGSASFLRDRERALKIERDNERYDSYDKAKQAASAQADRLLQAIGGEDLPGTMMMAMNAVASTMSGIADGVLKMKADFKKGGVAALIQGAKDAMTPEKPPQALQDAYDLVNKPPSASKDGAALSAPGLAMQQPIGIDFWNWVTSKFSGPKQAEVDGMRVGAGQGKEIHDWGALPKGNGVAAANDNMSRAQGEQKVAVRTTIDPIQVNMPSSITVNSVISGTINGPVSGSGSGSIPMSAVAPRGQTINDTRGAAAAGGR